VSSTWNPATMHIWLDKRDERWKRGNKELPIPPPRGLSQRPESVRLVPLATYSVCRLSTMQRAPVEGPQAPPYPSRRLPTSQLAGRDRSRQRGLAAGRRKVWVEQATGSCRLTDWQQQSREGRCPEKKILAWHYLISMNVRACFFSAYSLGSSRLLAITSNGAKGSSVPLAPRGSQVAHMQVPHSRVSLVKPTALHGLRKCGTPEHGSCGASKGQWRFWRGSCVRHFVSLPSDAAQGLSLRQALCGT